MNTELTLNEAERELVLELLQAERRELPVEIHHTRTARVHDDLQARLKLVDALIERLSKAPVA